MENFIGKLTQWMAGTQDGNSGAGEDAVQVAAAALMVHAMRIDDEATPEEDARVRQVLQSNFELQASDLERLVEKGASAEEGAVDLYRFTKVLRDELDLRGRQKIIRMLWEVAASDGEIHEYEANLVWRVAELIGVTREDRIRLRQAVIGRLATDGT